jgi:hypothetical protein
MTVFPKLGSGPFPLDARYYSSTQLIQISKIDDELVV